jgi:hypothetical protein
VSPRKENFPRVSTSQSRRKDNQNTAQYLKFSRTNEFAYGIRRLKGRRKAQSVLTLVNYFWGIFFAILCTSLALIIKYCSALPQMRSHYRQINHYAKILRKRTKSHSSLFKTSKVMHMKIPDLQMFLVLCITVLRPWIIWTVGPYVKRGLYGVHMNQNLLYRALQHQLSWNRSVVSDIAYEDGHDTTHLIYVPCKGPHKYKVVEYLVATRALRK